MAPLHALQNNTTVHTRSAAAGTAQGSGERWGCYYRSNRPLKQLVQKKNMAHTRAKGALACIEVSHADVHDDLLAARFNIRQIVGVRVVQVCSGEKVNGKFLPSKVFLVHLIHRKAVAALTLRALRRII
ncbi:MAG: hypothetical protein K0A89_09625 [ANME-2 cluster archaeon]|nr:hypothetical protein [ANME-2 cluster archaeon]